MLHTSSANDMCDGLYKSTYTCHVLMSHMVSHAVVTCRCNLEASHASVTYNTPYTCHAQLSHRSVTRPIKMFHTMSTHCHIQLLCTHVPYKCQMPMSQTISHTSVTRKCSIQYPTHATCKSQNVSQKGAAYQCHIK